ncbi:unnamed protein product [Phytophthora lilii]|uniref:Unnamed protein product n=1 Tax=Phytophthora lilii TaxID=2077276 RepID=A0A9W6YJT4_9STRA|nr:unnamed protein product [Phytophthora lilii]
MSLLRSPASLTTASIVATSALATMGNEVSRPAGDVSPQNSGVVPPRSPYTPTGGASRRAQSFSASLSPSSPSPQPKPQRRSSSSANLTSPSNPNVANPCGNPNANPRKERSIQRMDKAIRRRVRGGITYNMKLLIRGAKGTGKTSLFQRLQGEPIPETHQSTPQLQSATINWSFRQNLEENVKCEVWDVVDKGFVPVEEDGEVSTPSPETVEHGGLQTQGSLTAEATAAAAAAAAAMQNGTHSVAIVDASTVDVYHEAHGVIFLLDVTKWDTLEYVKQQLDNVPVHIPTLVLGNFRDQGAQRKIFKEDIQELLYGSSDRPQHLQWRRPLELLYFECSLLNCYGLKSLHQYFGIPFLQLKLATIRQQIRIVEGEFAHLKHDVQATISEERYVEYVEHIKATGSDIRTGRRGSGNGNTPPAASRSNSFRLSPKDAKPVVSEDADDDVSVMSKENGACTPPKNTSPVHTASSSVAEESQVEETKSVDMEDLPARSSSAVIQAAPQLKFEHKESVASIPDGVAENDVEDKPVSPEGQKSNTPATDNAMSGRARKASVEEVIHLEDFQVPKTRTSDLDHFYSEDESDEDAGDYDEDVVVAPVDGAMKASISGVYHKQRFIDSDSSDSDESEEPASLSRRKVKAPRKQSPRNTVTRQRSAPSQPVPKPPVSSPAPPSPHPPSSSSRPTQRSRPGSPARSQPSNPAKERQPSSPATSAATSVTPTPPTAPPTSPLASSIRHSSPRNKSDVGITGSQREMPVSVSPSHTDKNGVKNGSSSSEEPELTGTENAVVPINDNEETLGSTIREESQVISGDKTTLSQQTGGGSVAASVSDVEENDSDESLVTGDKEVAATKLLTEEIIQPNALNGKEANSEPEEVARVSTIDRQSKLVENGTDAGGNDAELEPNAETLTSFLAKDEDDSSEECGDDGPKEEVAAVLEAVVQAPSTLNPHSRRPEVQMSDDESGGDDDRKENASLSLASLQASLPIPESASQLSASTGIVNLASQDDLSGHYHKRNLEEAGDLLSLSALQASLPLPGQSVMPLSSTMHERMTVSMDYNNEGNNHEAPGKALQMSHFQASSVEGSSLTAPVAPDFSNVVPSYDLEAFLNESDSDAENTPPPSYTEPSKQVSSGRKAVVESSGEEDEEEDLNRFSGYSISKKGRSERRRQQKEDLRQLNAALDKTSPWDGESSDPFAPSTGTAAAASDSSFGNSDVMEAIRKAQEEAMRMLPTNPASVDDDAGSNSSKKRHKHKHKKEHKHRKGEDGSKDKSSKKSSRKSGSSSRSKKRRPHVEDDLA